MIPWRENQWLSLSFLLKTNNFSLIIQNWRKIYCTAILYLVTIVVSCAELLECIFRQILNERKRKFHQILIMIEKSIMQWSPGAQFNIKDIFPHPLGSFELALGSLYQHGLTLILPWISNYIHHKVWDKLTYPFTNFNNAAVEVWEWISNFIPHFTWHVISYPCWD